MRSKIMVYGIVVAASLLIFNLSVGCAGNEGEDIVEKEKSSEEVQMVRIYNYELKDYVDVPRMSKTDEEWKEILTKEQFYILRKEGTERPFTSELNKNKKKGVYRSAASGVALFHSDQKFDSGTGWPSFFDVVDKENVELREDNSLFTKRVEVVDKISGSHLGHVFEDGPEPTGLRYCINGDALIFEEEE